MALRSREEPTRRSQRAFAH